MEQSLLIWGNIFHGEPRWIALRRGTRTSRTPIKGPTTASATHAGGVNGIPGWKAYRAAVKDRALKQALVTEGERTPLHGC